jgi:hypothetical protein
VNEQEKRTSYLKWIDTYVFLIQHSTGSRGPHVRAEEMPRASCAGTGEGLVGTQRGDPVPLQPPVSVCPITQAPLCTCRTPAGCCSILQAHSTRQVLTPGLPLTGRIEGQRLRGSDCGAECPQQSAEDLVLNGQASIHEPIDRKSAKTVQTL